MTEFSVLQITKQSLFIYLLVFHFQPTRWNAYRDGFHILFIYAVTVETNITQEKNCARTREHYKMVAHFVENLIADARIEFRRHQLFFLHPYYLSDVNEEARKRCSNKILNNFVEANFCFIRSK